MDAKRFAIGTIVGGVVLYLTGYLIFDVVFANFYTANAGSATGVRRDVQLVWPMVLGSFSYAALISYAMGNRAQSSTIGEAVKVGAVVGFLIWFTVDFTFYGGTNLGNLTRTVVDPLLEIVHGGIGGGAMVLVSTNLLSSRRASRVAA
jgi:uncharacterized membrane protein